MRGIGRQHPFFVFVLGLLLLCFAPQQSNAQCCDWILSMHDSYGDGWNGGYLNVFVNNVSVGSFSATNYGSTVLLPVCNGDSVRFEYTAGAYENENSYNLFNSGYNALFSDGPTPQTGVVYNGIGNCAATFVAGNHPCTAISIDTGQCVWGDNSLYAGSGMQPGCAVYQGHDMWYKVLVPPSGNLSFETDSGTINDTGMAIWSDTACTQAQLLTCDDDAGNGYYSFISLHEQTPGKPLYIQVFGYAGAMGTFKLCVRDLGTVQLDSSRLPIVLLQASGQVIPEGTKIDIPMQIKYNGPNAMTYRNGPANVYNGMIGIEIRGASSTSFNQKPYGIETRNGNGGNLNVSLLGMPMENDWVLLSNYNDRSLLRNVLAHQIFTAMGHYSPRMHLCEVMLDTVYKGIYLLGEKIKTDNGRVSIAKLQYIDTVGDELTGGYILQQNYWTPTNSFQSNYSPIDHPGLDIHFLYQQPDEQSIHPLQKAYIAAFIDTLETALYSANFADTSNGYRTYLHEKSFIDYFIVNELARNADGFKKSVYFFKDKYSKGGKLHAGPVWDFDWAWKTMAMGPLFDQNDGSGWAHRINDYPTDNNSCGYYIRLLQDTLFANRLRCRYEGLRNSVLDTVNLFHFIDSVGQFVDAAQQRHFKKWPLLGHSGMSPESNAIATTYAAELDTFKHWIAVRLQWLDANIPGVCTAVPNGITELATGFAMAVYPNPTYNGRCVLSGWPESDSDMSLTVYDARMSCVGRYTIPAGKPMFELKLPQQGVLFFRVQKSDGEMWSGKVMRL